MVRTSFFGWGGEGGYPSSSDGNSPVAVSTPTDGYNRRLIEVDEDLLHFDDDDDDDHDDGDSDFEFVNEENDVAEDEGYPTIGPPLRRKIPVDTAALLNFDDFGDDFSDDDDDGEESESMEQWMQQYDEGSVITPVVPGTAYGYVSPSRSSSPRRSSVYYTAPSSPRSSYRQYHTARTSPGDTYSQFDTAPQSPRGYRLLVDLDVP